MLNPSHKVNRDLLTSMDYVRDNSLITQRQYSYDALGRPMTRETRYPNKAIHHADTFAYNKRSELTGALLDENAYTYAYDNIGNREIAQEVAEGITYAANDLNQYTRISTNGENFTPEYDADGNQTLIQTSTGTWKVQYNGQNRAVRFESEDGRTVITCGYDYMGRRFEKKVVTNGTTTLHERYIYRGYLQIAAYDLREGHAEHPDLRFIIWDPTQSVATRPLAIRENGVWYTYGWDLTKNICELYGQEGFIRTIYTYSPYGQVTAEGDVTQPIQWSSEVYDAETGLVYYNFRYYNPTDGRWTRRDPAGEEMGNLYCYIDNDVIEDTDYLGLIIDTIWDVGNMIWDAGVIAGGAITGDIEMVKEGTIDLLLDTAAAAIPGVPAGASKAARAAQKASKQAAKAAEKKALKKKLKRIAQCEAIYSQYKVYHCKKCIKCSTCAEIGERIACWTAFSAGRKLYLDKKCDYYLAGSIREGSKIKERSHKREYAEAAMNLAKCTSFLKNCR